MARRFDDRSDLQSPGDGVRRAIALVAGAVVLWALQDILVWGHFFENRGIAGADSVYQPWHQAFLFLLIILAVMATRGAWRLWTGCSIYLLSYGGWADVLYYWLQLKPVPATLLWLNDYHPLILGPRPVTDPYLETSAWIWLAVVTTAIYLGWVIREAVRD